MTTCLQCDQEFYPELDNQEYCSRDCEIAAKDFRSSGERRAVCVECEVVFFTRIKKQKYCSKACVGKVNRRKQIELSMAPYIRGHCVYAWFLGDEVLPCYIGQGIGERAFRCFKRTDGPEAGVARVQILLDGISGTEACNTEAVAIELTRTMGGCQWNHAPGYQTYPAGWEALEVAMLPSYVDQISPKVFVRKV